MLQVTTIKFPEIKLPTRDAHKLRGYFGNLFREHSSLLHNHFEDGTTKYAYPLVQYKVIDNIPVLTGLNEGGKLLTSLFLQIKKIEINSRIYEIQEKNIENKMYDIQVNKQLYIYQFKTLWMALNQKNFAEYIKNTETERVKQLESILQSNIISFLKGINYWAKEHILVKPEVCRKQTLFKNKKMLAFSGCFTTNILLPDYIGLGKSVSRGFGTIMQN